MAKARAATSSSIDLRGLNRALLARQLLLERADLPVTEAVARVGGLQAQWPKPPHLGLATRLARFSPADVVAAANANTLVRGTLHRGTLHLTSAGAYRSQRLALQQVLDRGLASILKNRPAFDIEAVLQTAHAVLEDGPMTFGILREQLLRAHPTVDERAMGYTVRMKLPLLMVPTEDTFGWPADSRFALAEQRIGKLGAEREGRRAFVLDYLAAFGPASVHDAQAASGFAALTPGVHGAREIRRAAAPAGARRRRQRPALRSRRRAATGWQDRCAGAPAAGARLRAAGPSRSRAHRATGAPDEGEPAGIAHPPRRSCSTASSPARGPSRGAARRPRSPSSPSRGRSRSASARRSRKKAPASCPWSRAPEARLRPGAREHDSTGSRRSPRRLYSTGSSFVVHRSSRLRLCSASRCAFTFFAPVDARLRAFLSSSRRLSTRAAPLPRR